MIKYILLCVTLMIGEFEGQVVISNVRGPTAITNLRSVHTNESSVVNVINSHEEAQLPTKDSTAFVVQDGVSSNVDDTSSDRNLHYQWARISQVYDGDDDDDDDDDDDYSNYKDYENNTDEGTDDNYTIINGPLVIHGTGSEGISVQSVQSDGEQNFYLSGGKTITINPTGISIHKMQNGEDRKSSVSITNLHNRGESVYVNPSGISIHKVQNNQEPVFDTAIPYGGGQGNYYPVKEETISLGPAGISIQKGYDRRPTAFITNIYDQARRQNYYPAKAETINVGPGGIFVQKLRSSRSLHQ